MINLMVILIFILIIKKLSLSDYELQTLNSEDNSYPNVWYVECSNDENERFVIRIFIDNEYLQ